MFGFGKLASFFVEFKAEGVNVVLEKITAIGEAMKKLAHEARWTGIGLGDMFKGSAQAAQGLALSLAPAAAAISGFAFAGIYASGAGQVLQFQMAEISRQVGSLFVPQIQLAIDSLGKLIGWFQGLTGAQQKQLREWGLLIVGFTTAAMILPKLVVGVQSLTLVTQGLSRAMIGLAVSNPFILIATVIAALVLSTMDWKDVMTALISVGEAVKEPFKDLVRVFKDLGDGVRVFAKEVMGIEIPDWIKWSMENLNFYKNTKEAFTPVKQAGEAVGAPKAGSGVQTYAAALLAVPLGVLATLGKVTGINNRMGWGDGGAIGGAVNDRQDLGAKVGGIEDIQSAWRRIAETTARITSGGKERPEERAVNYLEQIYATVQQLAGKAAEIRPPVVR